MATDFYQILGVSRDASQADIKRAYRKLAHQHHPDKAGGNEEKFKHINEAYQVLGDEGKRKQYDQFGSSFASGFGGQAGPTSGFEGFGADINLGDIFEQFFSGGGQRSGPQVRVGEDVGIDVTVSFREAAGGVKRTASPRMYHTCEVCKGNGAKPGTPMKECTTCKGTGSVEQTRQTPFGLFRQNGVCPTCHGEGKQATTACTHCRGQGRVLTNQELTIDVPAGIADGQTLRLSGKGEVPPHGGVAGDLYVNIHVEPDAVLTRQGDDVHSSLDLSFAKAALGTRLEVETLEGRRNLDIPSGTQPDSQFRLSRIGFPSLRGGGRGDHIITIHVQIPKRLTHRQRQALEEEFE